VAEEVLHPATYAVTAPDRIAVVAPGRRLTYAQAPLGRLASTGLAFAYMLLAIPALALFIIEVTFIPLVIITVGALVLPLVVPVVAALATLHRRMASRVLGKPVLPFYKSTEGLGWLGRLQRWAGDPEYCKRFARRK